MIAAAQTYGTLVDHVRSIGLAALIVTAIVLLPKIGRAFLARAPRPHTSPRVRQARRVVGNVPARRSSAGTPCPRSRRPVLRVVR